MPVIIFHKDGDTHSGEVKENTNLVVRAGIRQFPFPHLTYGCGMGKCAKCACKVIAGAEHLPPANWKEKNSWVSGWTLVTDWPASCGSIMTLSCRKTLSRRLDYVCGFND